MRTTDSVTLWLQCPTSTLHRYHNFNMNPNAFGGRFVTFKGEKYDSFVEPMKQCTPLLV